MSGQAWEDVLPDVIGMLVGSDAAPASSPENPDSSGKLAVYIAAKMRGADRDELLGKGLWISAPNWENGSSFVVVAAALRQRGWNLQSGPARQYHVSRLTK